jgi:hypothetical protein
MNQRTLWMLLATISVGGCAASSAPPPLEPSAASATVSLRLTGSRTTYEHATVEGNRIFGPNIELTSFGDAYRGHAYGEIVDLRWDGDRLVGRVGNGTATSLQFRQLTDGFDMMGMFSGSRGVLALRSNRMIGAFGSRRFDLVTDDGVSYRQQAGRPMEIVVSPGVTDLAPRERAVVLAMLLRH